MSIRDPQFAADVLTQTLENIRGERGQQWPLPLDEAIVDCDWEDEICPVCGHILDHHNNRDITRCANAR